jgi:hypothetical protein
MTAHFVPRVAELGRVVAEVSIEDGSGTLDFAGGSFLYRTPEDAEQHAAELQALAAGMRVARQRAQAHAAPAEVPA